MRLPRVVIGATRSGDGKTTVATGLMAALRARGLTVSPHKVGPDYIDPSYHAAASGRPGRNLDPWLVGEDLIAPLLLHGAAGADVAVVEGVMGLFDGAVGRGELASTAQVARLIDAPVVLVVSAGGMGRTVASVVRGLATWDADIRIGGVILNQVATDRHEQILRDALDGEGIPVVGALRREPALRAPSRHLGLVPAAERQSEVARWLPELRAVIERDLDLDLLLRIAHEAPLLAADPWVPEPSAGRARIAVATGPAFTFSYAEHAELLTAAGAEVLPFDPLTAPDLPDGTDALVVGGGFPEVYVEALADNVPLLEAVRTRVTRGLPTVAECAGLLWLAQSLDGKAQCGVLDTHAAMGPRLTLGYREATSLDDTPITGKGQVVRAHEFHRTSTAPAHGPAPAWSLSDGSEHGWGSPTLLASYLHLHWAGVPGAAQRLVTAAARVRA